jgi:hypothetical protein
MTATRMALKAQWWPRLCRCAVLGLLFLAASRECVAGDIAVLLGNGSHEKELQQIQQVADFYGLTLRPLHADSQVAKRDVLASLKSPQTVAAMISQDALPTVDRGQLLAALQRAGGTRVPVLIFGIASAGDAESLKLWSGGAIQACTALEPSDRPDALEAADLDLSGTLAGLKMPAVAAPVCSLSLDAGPRAQIALTARGGDRTAAVLVRTQEKSGETFFVPTMASFDSSWIGKPMGLDKAFSSLAPFFLFLRSAAGDYRWHSEGHYANFTIDDPWLTEPYGHLNYHGLLGEMEKHNFHSTIAFIPWNFDRSQPDVVQLFREHPDRFSISMHGDNHAHREFGAYQDHSLDSQIQDIQQGIARMERFRELTGIPYDRFMIFPHQVAPEGTFAALSEYEFLGTANSIQIPEGIEFPADPAFLLRPYTVKYGHFLSFFRYSVEGQVPRLEIAIHSFLGNPLLFYAHQQFFDDGIGAFDKVADLVNRTEPDTQWTSLGEIARHLYLLRRREDGQFDVRMLSNEMDLRNPSQRSAFFHLEGQDGSPASVRAVMVDGMPADLERSENSWKLTVEIPGGKVSQVRVVHGTNLDVTQVDIQKTSTYVFLLRRASDFRDMYLSKSSIGRAITRSYYQEGWDSYQLVLEKQWWSIAAGLLIVIGGLLYLRRRARKARFTQTTMP